VTITDHRHGFKLLVILARPAAVRPGGPDSRTAAFLSQLPSSPTDPSDQLIERDDHIELSRPLTD
jgi:hypothetical protein